MIVICREITVCLVIAAGLGLSIAALYLAIKLCDRIVPKE
ncbi:Uncharacterised protein [uncultured archaeon]|nr:Uncharacterised protein [uncultured archaeon]